MRLSTFSFRSSPSAVTWRGTWFSTFNRISNAYLSHISCENLFSDLIHRPFFCAHTPLHSYSSNIPPINLISTLSDLSPAEFSTIWTDKPFILTDPVREWPAYQTWVVDELIQKYGEVKFRAEAVDWSLKTYVDYMNDTSDESPLYLFDRFFVEKMDIEVGKENNGQYWAPECFGEDLFAALGNKRPHSRWLIVGPERSGSTFHKDPNATRSVSYFLTTRFKSDLSSAWNAVLRGSKYWIMFPASPSTPPPPGVFVSEDQSEVTSPLSIAEWLLGFHAEARMSRGCVEGICHEGEVLHVPSGWWHLVVNLSPSIAITQNFVPRNHLTNVLAFLKDKPSQVSGFRGDIKNPYETFVDKLKELHPAMLEDALEELERSKDGRKRKWKQLVNGHKDEHERRNGFSFGFGDGDEVEVP